MVTSRWSCRGCASGWGPGMWNLKGLELLGEGVTWQFCFLGNLENFEYDQVIKSDSTVLFKV